MSTSKGRGTEARRATRRRPHRVTGTAGPQDGPPAGSSAQSTFKCDGCGQRLPGSRVFYHDATVTACCGPCAELGAVHWWRQARDRARQAASKPWAGTEEDRASEE